MTVNYCYWCNMQPVGTGMVDMGNDPVRVPTCADHAPHVTDLRTYDAEWCDIMEMGT